MAVVRSLRRWWRYHRTLARLMREAADNGERVRSRQRYEQMRARARQESAAR